MADDGTGREGTISISPIDRHKRLAAEEAVKHVKDGMRLGLGGGSTAALAIRLVADRLRRGKLRDVIGIPCGRSVAEMARSLGIPLAPDQELPAADLTIDGADEVDPDLNLIKGGGGQLLREKIVAQDSRRVMIVVDESKLSPALGTRFRLPVEVPAFGLAGQLRYLRSLGGNPTLRRTSQSDPFLTDEGNFILDCAFGPIDRPAELARVLEGRAGVVGHGLFVGLATDVIVAGEGGLRHLHR